ncbi:MAG: serine/threonine-protein phosphatase [Actinobacteria bacterium]|nr:serine/threonine-protein phosphatase [Actinomycetota bacterium]
MKSVAGPRDLNEDRAYIQDYVDDAAPRRFLCLGAVADGMGGHKAGEVASDVAIQLLFREFNERRAGSADDEGASGEDLLFDLFSAINATVYELNLRDDELKGMGTTLTAFLAEEGRASIAHVGDCRAYLIRGSSISQLTEDHTLVESMVRDNIITREQAAVHSDRHVITRAIGVEQSVSIDLLSFSIKAGDIIMLCTDGLYDVVNPQEFLAVIGGSSSMQSACEELVRLAIDKNTTDNVTVMLWKVPEPLDVPVPGHTASDTANATPSPAGDEKALKPEAHPDSWRFNRPALAAIFSLCVIAGFILGWLIAAWL